MIEIFFKYFHTIRFLKISQIIWRILKRFKSTNTSEQKLIDQRDLINKWYEVRIAKVHILDKSSFEFLNKSHNYLGSIDWNDSEQEMLWLFNLHYFDDLCSPFDPQRNIWLRELVDNWIDNNPPMYGVGWEAYPLSLRIVNWIKWILNGESIDSCWLHSLKLQMHILSQNIEYHLLGNHLLANAKALIFGGLFFKGQKAEGWLNLGLKIYNKQLQEQILPDGGHFELSTMYQNIMLNDLLDLINISKSYDHPEVSKFLNDWCSKAGLMLSWANTMKHPDGEISFFNDAAFGIAPSQSVLDKYAKAIGIQVPVLSKESINGTELTPLPQSGYFRVEQPNLVAILDCAKIGPDYLPGHGHADILSFELSLYNFRVLVNSGTSCYGTNLKRVQQRGTAAHNTVTINNLDSSQVWSGFRVAKRAYPFDFQSLNSTDNLIISCSHGGYKRLKDPVIHRRSWNFASDSMTITDKLIGKFDSAKVHYFFHPDVQVNDNSNSFVMTLPNKVKCVLEISGGEARLVETVWNSEFGKSVASSGLIINFTEDKIDCSISGYI